MTRGQVFERALSDIASYGMNGDSLDAAVRIARAALDAKCDAEPYPPQIRPPAVEPWEDGPYPNPAERGFVGRVYSADGPWKPTNPEDDGDGA